VKYYGFKCALLRAHISFSYFILCAQDADALGSNQFIFDEND